MTREHKIALIVGFALVLLVGVAVSDHLSQARTARLEPGLTDGESFANAGDMDAPIPSASPLDQFAAVPEWPAPNKLADAAPTEPTNSAEPDRPVTDFLARLRDRVQDMPIAAKTLTDDSAPTIDNETPPPAPPARPQSVEASTPSLPALNISDADITWHSVVEGETLWSIAKKHYGDGSLAGKLAEFNGAKASNPDIIRVGVRLRVPPRHALTGEAAPTITQAPLRKSSNETSFRLYTIKRGDTLGEIAMRELGTIKRLNEIVKLNAEVLRDLDNIPVGATLRLPAK